MKVLRFYVCRFLGHFWGRLKFERVMYGVYDFRAECRWCGTAIVGTRRPIYAEDIMRFEMLTWRSK